LPFIVQWKGHLPAGKTYDQPAVQLDVLPSCVTAAGGTVDPAWKLDGVNLLPYLTGENQTRPHETLYWKIDGMWAIRHGDWKLVHGQANDEAPELFNLAVDASEKNNLSATEPARVQELHKMWYAWNAEQAPPVNENGKAGKKAKRAAKAAKKAAK
jgi:arylsulfatase A-like enzyme